MNDRPPPTTHKKRATKIFSFCLPRGRKLAFNQNPKSRETVGQNASNWSVEPIKKSSGFITAIQKKWELNTASEFTFSVEIFLIFTGTSRLIEWQLGYSDLIEWKFKYPPFDWINSRIKILKIDSDMLNQTREFFIFYFLFLTRKSQNSPGTGKK